MKRIFFYVFVVICFFSCRQLTPEQKKINNTLGKHVYITMFDSIREGNKNIAFNEFRNNYHHISLVPLVVGCRPCFPKYIEWTKNMEGLNINDNYTVLFIIQGGTFKMFLNTIENPEMEFYLFNNKFHIVMDPYYKFLDKNPDIDNWVFDQSILIDSKDKIRLIGQPFASKQMLELFNNICKE